MKNKFKSGLVESLFRKIIHNNKYPVSYKDEPLPALVTVQDLINRGIDFKVILGGLDEKTVWLFG